MTRYPIFVPVDGSHVAAVVTVPETDPHGLVLLLAGTGRHNPIGSTFSASLSERLAAFGLASVRLDYAGVGDSTGTVTSWTPSDVGAAAAQARAALREASGALGVPSFATVGTCYGSRVALTLVPDPGCVGAVCLAPPIVDAGAAGLRGRPGGLGLASFVRSSPALRRIVVTPLRAVRRIRKPRSPALGALAHLDRTRIVFLYGRNPADDHYSNLARQRIEAAVQALPPDRRARFELRMLDAGPLTTFDGLGHDEQDAILDAVVPYVRACFELPVEARPAAAAGARSSS